VLDSILRSDFENRAAAGFGGTVIVHKLFITIKAQKFKIVMHSVRSQFFRHSEPRMGLSLFLVTNKNLTYYERSTNVRFLR